jgi:hypothetical protein
MTYAISILAAATGKPPKGGFPFAWVIFFIIAALVVGFFFARGRRR